jgi:hypothetical protein
MHIIKLNSDDYIGDFMKHYLAPYSFEIKNGSKQNLIDEINHIISIKKYEDNDNKLRLKIIKLDVERGVLKGIVKYGKFGYAQDVVNENGEVISQVYEDDSVMDNHIFLFKFINNNSGYLILERIGGIGVKSFFHKSLSALRGTRVNIKPEIVGINEILENPMKRIKFKRRAIPKDYKDKMQKLERFMGNEIPFDDLEFEAHVVAKRNKFIGAFSRLKLQYENKILSNIATIVDENEELIITAKVGKNQRTINVTSNKVRTYVEIKNKDNDYKYNEALKLINDILIEKGLTQ